MTASLSLCVALLAGAWNQVEVSEPEPAPPSAPPLMVIVERGRGANVSPDAIRHAIAVELGRPVVGPMNMPDGDDSEMLVVTITADAVKMQMRSAGVGEPDRQMAALPSGEMGLKVVAWLAGNLARHQAADFVRDAPAHQRWQALEPPAAPVKTPPPQPSVARAEEPSPEAVVAHAPATSEPLAVPKLRVGVSLGRTVRIGDYPNTRVEVLGALRARHWFWNATLDIVQYGNPGLQDFNGTVGLTRRFALWRGWLDLDLTGGLGISIAQRWVITVSQASMGSISTSSTDSSFTVGGVLADATAMLAMTHWRFVELVAGATVLVGVADLAIPANLRNEPGIVAIAGVRIGLPE